VVTLLVSSVLVGTVGIAGAVDPLWTSLSSWGSDGTADGEFDHPIAITVDSKGDVSTAENGGGTIKRMQKFDGHGTHMGSFFVDEPGAIMHALDSDDEGNVWRGDAGMGRLIQIDGDGLPTGRSFGTSAGAGPGVDNEFTDGCPCGVAVAPGQDLLYGSNGPDGRVLVFNLKTNKFLRDFDIGAHAGPLATDSAGNVYVVDGILEVVKKFNKKGVLLATVTKSAPRGGQARAFTSLAAVAVDNDDRLYVLDASGVQVLDSGGTLVAGSEFDGGSSPIDPPQGIATDGMGNVYTIQGVPGEDSKVQRLMFGPAVAKCKGRVATILGTLGDDNGTNAIVGTAAADVIVGLDGDDLIKAKGGNDRVCAGAGKDKVVAGGGNDRVWGQDGNDRLLGGGGDDTLRGGNGNDKVFGSAGADKLVGGGGDDNMRGQGGDDTLNGGGGDDTLNGGPDNDTGNGGPGADTCIDIETAKKC